MPGLAGIVSGEGHLDRQDGVIGAFKAVHALAGVNLHYREFQSEQSAIVNILTGLIKGTLDQPASSMDRNTFLFLEGQITNREELLEHLDAPRNLSVCDILLTLYMESGNRFVSLLRGEFNIVIYQKVEKRLTILNDHLSSKPIYYMQQGDCLLFGSEIKSILAISGESPKIDPVGLLQMFAHRHHVGGRTYIKGLKCLPPASCLEFYEGHLSCTRWNLKRFHVPNSSPKQELLVEAWADHLKRATVRYLKDKERVVMSQSAGLDSRAVACAIPRDFRPLVARTRGYEDALEVIYGAEIARRLGFEHYREAPETVPLSNILPKVVWRTESMIPFINGMTMASHATIKQYGDFMSGGWLGDASSGAHLRSFMFLPGTRTHFLEMVYRWYLLYPETALRDVFAEEFLYKNFPLMKEAFLASFDPLEGETHTQVFEVWNLYERQTRMTLSAGPVDSHCFEYVRPFLDEDYMNFVLTLPARLRYGQVLYQAMIYHLGPEIRDIPNSNTNLTLKDTTRGNWMNMGIAFGRKSQSRLLKKVMPAYRSKFERADVGDLASLVRQDQALRQTLESFVHASYFDSSIFNKSGILRLVERHYQGAANHASLLCVLATFAVGLSYFVYNRTLHCPPEAEPAKEVAYSG